MRRLLIILITLSVAGSSVRADLLDDAIQAHRAGIPEVSITKLRKFLAGQPPQARAETAQILLARCLIETQKMEEAAQVLKSATGPEAVFLKAQEALRSKRYKEAADYFGELIGSTNEFSVEARLGLADTQKTIGELEAALKTLAPLIADERSADPRAQLIAAEILLKRRKYLRGRKAHFGAESQLSKNGGGKNLSRR